MKKLLSLFFVLVIVFCGCDSTRVEHVEDVSHTIMGDVAIDIPESASNFAKAIYEATDMTVNEVANEIKKGKPEFLSFEFSSDVMLSQAEKETLLSLFSVYGVEISTGIQTELADLDRGFSVAYGSIQSTQTSDCDLTIPVKVYYGKSFYTYCRDFKTQNGEYVLFRFEQLSRTRVVF